jgi:hypothetical protein
VSSRTVGEDAPVVGAGSGWAGGNSAGIERIGAAPADDVDVASTLSARRPTHRVRPHGAPGLGAASLD